MSLENENITQVQEIQTPGAAAVAAAIMSPELSGGSQAPAAIEALKAETTAPVVESTTPTTTPVQETTEEEVYAIAQPKPAEPAHVAPEAEQSILKRYESKGIKSLTELDALFDRSAALAQETIELRKQLESAPKINESQKKYLDFVKDFNTEDPAAFNEYTRLITTDPSKLSDKDTLKEVYVLENRGIPRQQAEKEFDYLYKKNWSTEGLVEGDNDEEIEERKMLESIEARKARPKLVEAISKASPTKQEPVQENQYVKESINTLTGAVPRILDNMPKSKDGTLSLVPIEYDVLIGTEPINGKVNIGLSKDQLTFLAKPVTDYLAERSNYDEKGILKNGLTPESVVTGLAEFYFKKDIHAAMIRHGFALANKIAASKGLPSALPTQSASPEPSPQAFELNQKNVAELIVAKK